jgi:hypothetical protein
MPLNLAMIAAIVTLMLIAGLLGFWRNNPLSRAIGRIGYKTGLPYEVSVIAVVIGLGIFLGGFAVIGGWWSGLTAGNLQLASITETPAQTQALDLVNCQINTIGATTGAVAGNIYFRADPNDNTHYYIDLTNVTNSGAGSINGTVVCDRTGDVDKSASGVCTFESGTYTNKQSSTDPALYRMVSLAAGASQVSGVPAGFKQVAYLNDGAIATTSSKQEKTTLTFTGGSSAQAQETLGFYFTLPGATNVNYLNVQDSVNNKVVCEGKQVAWFTVTKIGA